MAWRRSSHPARIHPSTSCFAIAALSAAGACILPTRAHAQWGAEAELGGAHVTQAQYPGRAAGTLQGSTSWEHRWLGVQGSAALTQPSGERVRVHALLGGVMQTAVERPVSVELSGFGSVYDDGVFPRASSAFADLRAHAHARAASAWTGVGIGTLDDGVNSYPMTTIGGGVATAWRGAHFTASATWHGTLGEPRTEFVEQPVPVEITVRDRIAYTDATFSGRAAPGRLELEARVGTRAVHRTIMYEEKPGLRAFGGIDAAWWVNARAALVVSAGRELADLARGLPDSRYVSAGVRFRIMAPRPLGRAIVGPTARSAAPEVLVEQGATAGAQLHVLVGAARRVEVAGTFTAWEPVALVADGDGLWTLSSAIPAGPHRLMLRIDDGDWVAPANLPSLEDELGGRVGLVTVP